MKDWFKYEYGFVNIDAENIYLNNSGNWSDLGNLNEKSTGTSHKKSWRSIRMTAYLFFCLILFFTLGMLKLHTGIAGILLLAGLLFAGFSLYQYIRPELGAQFRIPIHKIKSITIEHHSIQIEFENKENQTEKINLDGVDEKGILLLSKIK